jgi:hypothetical protein
LEEGRNRGGGGQSLSTFYLQARGGNRQALRGAGYSWDPTGPPQGGKVQWSGGQGGIEVEIWGRGLAGL